MKKYIFGWREIKERIGISPAKKRLLFHGSVLKIRTLPTSLGHEYPCFLCMASGDPRLPWQNP
jgi:hypothetical protein